MKQEIPQDVLDKFREQLRGFLSGKPCECDSVTKLIEAAQLPLAPATEEEVARMQGDFYVLNAGGGLSKHETRTVLNQFISRRTPPPQLPPQVDALEETIAKELKANTYAVLDYDGIAKKIAVRVRETENGKSNA